MNAINARELVLAHEAIGVEDQLNQAYKLIRMAAMGGLYCIVNIQGLIEPIPTPEQWGIMTAVLELNGYTIQEIPEKGLTEVWW